MNIFYMDFNAPGSLYYVAARHAERMWWTRPQPTCTTSIIDVETTNHRWMPRRYLRREKILEEEVASPPRMQHTFFGSVVPADL